jgi:hypothetical protein
LRQVVHVGFQKNVGLAMGPFYPCDQWAIENRVADWTVDSRADNPQSQSSILNPHQQSASEKSEIGSRQPAGGIVL